MRFIELHNRGERIFVNADRITVVAAKTMNVGTPFSLSFDETQDEVMAKIAEIS